MRTLADELDVHILEIENPLTHPWCFEKLDSTRVFWSPTSSFWWPIQMSKNFRKFQNLFYQLITHVHVHPKDPQFSFTWNEKQ
jgi:hypothetical protein